MKKLKRIPVTVEGLDELKQKLENLREERPGAVKNLAEARSLGDLSENGLYTAAKARLRSIDSQIFRLEMQIKLADVIGPVEKGVVGLGSTVVVLDGADKKTFKIVGDFEANPKVGRISQNSPLGKSLMGKRENEKVTFEAPAGVVTYKILLVS